MQICVRQKTASLFHLPPHKSSSALCEDLFCHAHFAGAVFSAQNDGTDHIALTCLLYTSDAADE